MWRRVWDAREGKARQGIQLECNSDTLIKELVVFAGYSWHDRGKMSKWLYSLQNYRIQKLVSNHPWEYELSEFMQQMLHIMLKAQYTSPTVI